MIINSVHTDDELLHLIAQDDEAAFGVLVERYSEKVFLHTISFVKAYSVAEELVQDIFLKIWKHRAKLHEIESFDNYLFILSRNHILSAMKKHLMQTVPVGANVLEELFFDPEEQFEKREFYSILEKGLSFLPEQKRVIFRLIHQDGLTQEATAERLSISPRTVRWNLVSAIHFLREYLRKSGARMFSIFF